jgi:hypothetical protein
VSVNNEWACGVVHPTANYRGARVVCQLEMHEGNHKAKYEDDVIFNWSDPVGKTIPYNSNKLDNISNRIHEIIADYSDGCNCDENGKCLECHLYDLAHELALCSDPECFSYRSNEIGN